MSYSVLAMQPSEVSHSVASGEADIGFTFVTDPSPAGLKVTAEVPAPIGVVMRADHPLSTRLLIRFDDVRSFPIFTQPGAIPKAIEADVDYADFRTTITPKVFCNSIQMLKLCVMLNMGVALFTRLGFLQEISAGDLVWRPFDSPVVNRLRIGLVVSANRTLSPPAGRLARQLAADLVRVLGI